MNRVARYAAVALLSTMYLLSQEHIVDLWTIPTDAQAKQRRQYRNDLFSIPGGFPPLSDLKSHAQKGLPPPVIVVHPRPMVELPVELSDAIVIGNILTEQPWLSSDGKVLYTEFSVSRDRLVYKKPSIEIPNSTFDIVRHGFDKPVRTPEGSILPPNPVQGYGLPIKRGARYVFFLEYVQRGDVFRLVKAWQISDGGAKAVYQDDLQRVASGRSLVGGYSEDQLIAAIRAALPKE